MTPMRRREAPGACTPSACGIARTARRWGVRSPLAIRSSAPVTSALAATVALTLAVAACAGSAGDGAQSAVECPPCAAEELAASAEPATTPPPSTLPRPRSIELKADDGHRLRLWHLAGGDPLPGSAPAILLLHGRTWSSLPDFDLRVGGDPSLSLMHSLAVRGVAAYALDLRGYGETERDATGWNEPERAAEDVAAALAEIREREGHTPDLLGWSYGAIVAQLTLQRHPEAARKLVLYGYPRDPYAAGGEKPRSAADADAPPTQAPRRPNTAEAAASDFITPGSISKAAIAAFVEAALASDKHRADWRRVDQFFALDPAAIRSPTLVIHGVHDPIARPAWQAALFQGLKVEDRQWVVVPGADHAAHLEDPGAFVRALVSFLEVDPEG